MNIIQKLQEKVLSFKNNRGNVGVEKLVGVVIVAVLIGALAPTILTGLFNMSTTGTGIPTYAPLVLGILGLTALIFILLKAGKGGK